MNSPKEKFPFTLDYELDLLRYTCTNREGYQALELFHEDYFTSIEHGAIADCLRKYYKKKRRIPGATIFKEELIALFKTRDYANSLTAEDKATIFGLIPKLYTPPRDGEDILKMCAQWASYVVLKDQIEGVNLLDFNSYTTFSNKVLKAINIGITEKKEVGTSLIKDIHERQFKRLDVNPIVPTPFHQINALTNAGGYVRGSIIVLLDKPKARKTLALTNVARGYMKMKKKVFFADLENGEDELTLRIEQQISKQTKPEILSGQYDEKVQRILRKYARLGGEIWIKRYPAGSTILDFQVDLDRLKRDEGVEFDDMVCDYAALMGSVSGKDDDFNRISDVYLDLANFGLKNHLEHIWTANHIVRDGKKRSKSKYTENDIAKCIDIVRHVQAIFGLNGNDYEIENNIMRMELVVQRDGKPWGRAVFHCDPNIQRIDEFTKNELIAYEHQMQDDMEDLNKEFKGDLD